jgi:tRNA pseudouridine55 synthase
MGEFLGCGAHLKSLRRLSCGSLILEQAVTLEELARLKEKNKVPLISLNDALSHLPEFELDVEGIALLRMGRQEMLAQFPPPQGNETVARITDGKGNLVALVHWINEGNQLAWRLSRVLSSETEIRDRDRFL